METPDNDFLDSDENLRTTVRQHSEAIDELRRDIVRIGGEVHDLRRQFEQIK